MFEHAELKGLSCAVLEPIIRVEVVAFVEGRVVPLFANEIEEDHVVVERIAAQGEGAGEPVWEEVFVAETIGCFVGVPPTAKDAFRDEQPRLVADQRLESELGALEPAVVGEEPPIGAAVKGAVDASSEAEEVLHRPRRAAEVPFEDVDVNEMVGLDQTARRFDEDVRAVLEDH